MLLSSSDTRETQDMHLISIVYKFRPERTGFNMYATAINLHYYLEDIEVPLDRPNTKQDLKSFSS